MAVTGSFSECVMIRYVLPVFWMPSYFHSVVLDVYFKRREYNSRNYCKIALTIIVVGCALGEGRCLPSMIALFLWQYVNPAYERLLGYKSDEIIGRNSYELTRSDYTKPDIINSISSQLRAGQVRQSPVSYTHLTLPTILRV